MGAFSVQVPAVDALSFRVKAAASDVRSAEGKLAATSCLDAGYADLTGSLGISSSSGAVSPMGRPVGRHDGVRHFQCCRSVSDRRQHRHGGSVDHRAFVQSTLDGNDGMSQLLLVRCCPAPRPHHRQPTTPGCRSCQGVRSDHAIGSTGRFGTASRLPGHDGSPASTWTGGLEALGDTSQVLIGMVGRLLAQAWSGQAAMACAGACSRDAATLPWRRMRIRSAVPPSSGSPANSPLRRRCTTRRGCSRTRRRGGGAASAGATKPASIREPAESDVRLRRSIT